MAFDAKKYQRKYYKAHKKELKKYACEYYKTHKKERKEYRKKNKSKIKKQHHKWYKKWHEENKTGYAPGRPRDGEVRPVNKGAEAFKRWYYKQKETNPDFGEYIRQRSMRQRLKNPEKYAKYIKDHLLRKKGWKKADGNEIPDQVVENISIDVSDVVMYG